MAIFLISTLKTGPCKAAAIRPKPSKLRPENSYLKTRSAKPAGVNPHALNEFSFVLPEYRAGHMRVGEIVATVNAEDGSPWGYYRFMGVANYRGKPAAVLDLQRAAPGLESAGSIVFLIMYHPQLPPSPKPSVSRRIRPGPALFEVTATGVCGLEDVRG